MLRLTASPYVGTLVLVLLNALVGKVGAICTCSSSKPKCLLISGSTARRCYGSTASFQTAFFAETCDSGECDASYSKAYTRCDDLLGGATCDSECPTGGRFSDERLPGGEIYKKTTTSVSGCACDGNAFPVYQKWTPCSDTCTWTPIGGTLSDATNDGVCDEPIGGATDPVCAAGTDCSDCGRIMHNKFLYFSCTTGKWGTTVAAEDDYSPTTFSAHTEVIEFSSTQCPMFRGQRQINCYMPPPPPPMCNGAYHAGTDAAGCSEYSRVVDNRGTTTTCSPAGCRSECGSSFVASYYDQVLCSSLPWDGTGSSPTQRNGVPLEQCTYKTPDCSDTPDCVKPEVEHGVCHNHLKYTCRGDYAGGDRHIAVAYFANADCSDQGVPDPNTKFDQGGTPDPITGKADLLKYGPECDISKHDASSSTSTPQVWSGCRQKYSLRDTCTPDSHPDRAGMAFKFKGHCGEKPDSASSDAPIPVIIGGAVGGLLLLCCCCIGIGGGVFYMKKKKAAAGGGAQGGVALSAPVAVAVDSKI